MPICRLSALLNKLVSTDDPSVLMSFLRDQAEVKRTGGQTIQIIVKTLPALSSTILRWSRKFLGIALGNPADDEAQAQIFRKGAVVTAPSRIKISSTRGAPGSWWKSVASGAQNEPDRVDCGENFRCGFPRYTRSCPHHSR